MKTLKISMIVSVIVIAALMYGVMSPAHATDKYIYAAPQEGDPINIIFEQGTTGPTTTVVTPLVTYTYVPIRGTFNTNHGGSWGPYDTYAISVKNNSVSPSGYSLTVTILRNGVSIWSGQLGAGQSSPTENSNGYGMTIHEYNENSVQVLFTGTITLINN